MEEFNLYLLLQMVKNTWILETKFGKNPGFDVILEILQINNSSRFSISFSEK